MVEFNFDFAGLRVAGKDLGRKMLIEIKDLINFWPGRRDSSPDMGTNLVEQKKFNLAAGRFAAKNPGGENFGLVENQNIVGTKKF